MEVIEQVEAHWIDEFLFDDVDQPSPSMPDLARTHKCLHVCFVKDKLKIELVQQVFPDAVQFSGHNGRANTWVIDEIEHNDIIAKSVQQFWTPKCVVEVALNRLLEMHFCCLHT